MSTTTSSAPPVSSTGGATVHLTLVLDRSGSMEKIRADVIGGVNALVAEQQAQPGTCKFTMVMFDTQGYDYIHMATDIHQVSPIGEADFVPRSGTNLYDAIGRAVTELDVRVGAKNSPEVQIFAIFTDGEENSSRSYTRDQIFIMIEEHQAKGWTFTYLGANQDAYAQSASMGISRGSTQAYAGDGAGAHVAYTSLAANVTAARSSVAAGQTINNMAFFDGAGKFAEADLLSRKPDEAAKAGVTDDESADASAPSAE